jgi:hypothetical protein
MISAAFGLVGAVRTTTSGPRDWRLILVWVSALATLGLAVGSVLDKDKLDELK